MKKITLVFLLFLITASHSLFAQKQTLIASNIQHSFEAAYGYEQNVSWEKIADVYVGRFTHNNQNLEVYFSAAGELLAYARYIPTPYLPQLVSHAITTRFPGRYVREILEYTSATEGTVYFVHMVNANVDLYAKADRDGDIEVVKKTKK